MIKKIISALVLILFLGSAPFSGTDANVNSDFSTVAFMGRGSAPMTTEKSIAYDQAKNSSERRGTENWEQPQWSFFVVPGVFMGLALLVLFFNRKN